LYTIVYRDNKCRYTEVIPQTLYSNSKMNKHQMDYATSYHRFFYSLAHPLTWIHVVNVHWLRQEILMMVPWTRGLQTQHKQFQNNFLLISGTIIHKLEGWAVEEVLKWKWCWFHLQNIFPLIWSVQNLSLS